MSGNTVEVVTLESCSNVPYNGITRAEGKMVHLGGDRFRWYRTRKGAQFNQVLVAPLDSSTVTGWEV